MNVLEGNERCDECGKLSNYVMQFELTDGLPVVRICYRCLVKAVSLMGKHFDKKGKGKP